MKWSSYKSKLAFLCVLLALLGLGILSFSQQKVQNQTSFTPTPTLTKASIPQGWKSYTDNYYSYVISYPPDWKVEPTKGGLGSMATLEGKNSQGDRVVVEISKHIDNLRDNESLHDYEIRRTKALKLDVLNEETITLSNNLTAQRYIIKRIYEGTYGVYYIFAQRNNVYFIVGYTKDYVADQHLFDQILSTISL